MTKMDIAQERKAQIVQATVECIAKYGYHNFSMQDVASIAGVSKGIIHYYFLNKDDLLKSVLDRVALDIEKVMIEEMQAVEDPVDKITIFIDVGFNIVRSAKEYYQVNMDFWTQINQNEEIRKVIARHYTKFRETAINILNEGIAKGKFNPVNPTEFSSMIVALIDGVSLQWLFDEKIFAYDKMVEASKNLLLAGLLINKNKDKK